MIKEGCLDKVDEVYGFHNVPNFEEGDLRICVGPIMSTSTTVLLTIRGKGGHGSLPHLVQDVISAGA